MAPSRRRLASLRVLALALAATAALISGCSATSAPSVAVTGTVPPSLAVAATPHRPDGDRRAHPGSDPRHAVADAGSVTGGIVLDG